MAKVALEGWITVGDLQDLRCWQADQPCPTCLPRNPVRNVLRRYEGTVVFHVEKFTTGLTGRHTLLTTNTTFTAYFVFRISPMFAKIDDTIHHVLHGHARAACHVERKGQFMPTKSPDQISCTSPRRHAALATNSRPGGGNMLTPLLSRHTASAYIQNATL